MDITVEGMRNPSAGIKVVEDCTGWKAGKLGYLLCCGVHELKAFDDVNDSVRLGVGSFSDIIRWSIRGKLFNLEVLVNGLCVWAFQLLAIYNEVTWVLAVLPFESVFQSLQRRAHESDTTTGEYMRSTLAQVQNIITITLKRSRALIIELKDTPKETYRKHPMERGTQAPWGTFLSAAPKNNPSKNPKVKRNAIAKSIGPRLTM
jgi:hypothetical protein